MTLRCQLPLVASLPISKPILITQHPPIATFAPNQTKDFVCLKQSTRPGVDKVKPRVPGYGLSTPHILASLSPSPSPKSQP